MDQKIEERIVEILAEGKRALTTLTRLYFFKKELKETSEIAVIEKLIDAILSVQHTPETPHDQVTDSDTKELFNALLKYDFPSYKHHSAIKLKEIRATINHFDNGLGKMNDENHKLLLRYYRIVMKVYTNEYSIASEIEDLKNLTNKKWNED